MDSCVLRQLFWRFSFGLLVLGSSVGNCVAPVTAREPGLRERERLAETFLKEKLALWQRRLQLQEWTISIIPSRASALRPGTRGNIRWDADTKTATIRVLDASEYPMPFRVTLEDMEFTVVHELIHLTLSPLPRNESSRSKEEYAINRIADALLQGDRDKTIDLGGSGTGPKDFKSL